MLDGRDALLEDEPLEEVGGGSRSRVAYLFVDGVAEPGILVGPRMLLLPQAPTGELSVGQLQQECILVSFSSKPV